MYACYIEQTDSFITLRQIFFQSDGQRKVLQENSKRNHDVKRHLVTAQYIHNLIECLLIIGDKNSFCCMNEVNKYVISDTKILNDK